MKTSFFSKLLAFAPAVGLAFFSYGGGRTLGTDFGLSWSGFAFGMFLTALALAAFTALAWLVIQGAFSLWRGRGPQWSRSAVKSICLMLLAGSLLGAAASEASLQADEHHFIREAEAAKAQGGGQMARDRCWPNEGCSLVWAPDHGFWATD